MLYEKGIEKANREMKKILKLQRSESFYIREGWLRKGVVGIEKYEYLPVFLPSEALPTSH